MRAERQRRTHRMCDLIEAIWQLDLRGNDGFEQTFN